MTADPSLPPLQAPVGREDMRIEAIRPQSAAPAHIDPHSHNDMLQLVMATGGSCIVTLDGTVREVAAPCLIAIPGGTVHGFEVMAGASGWMALIRHHRVLEVVMTLRVDAARLLARPYVVDLAQEPAQAQDLAHVLAMIERESAAPRDGQAICLEALQRLLLVRLSRIIEQDRHTAAPPRRADHDLFLEFRALVERRFTRTHTIAHYARALNTTPARLNTLCQRYAGRSAKQVLTDRLIDEARRRLRFTAAHAAEIALSLGFAEPSYFVRMFRKQTSMTPGRYRAEGIN